MQAVYTRIEQNKPVSTNKIDTTSSSLATQEEDEFFPLRVVELINKFLPLRDTHGAVESETPVPEKSSVEIAVDGYVRLFAPAKLFEQI